MAKTNREKTTASETAIQKQNGVPRTRALAGGGISTEDKINRALDAIFDDLADDQADPEKTRYMLSAIGKRLTVEAMKIRAGFYKGAKFSGGGDSGAPAGPSFFLKA